jgi:phosphatidylglycerol lysyltransferase
VSAGDTDNDKGLLRSAVGRIREAKFVGPLVGVVVAAAAAYVIFRISADINLKQVATAIGKTPWSTIALSTALTVVSFGAISLYDVVAAHRVAPNRVSSTLAAFAGASSHAIASVVGSDVLIGGPIRYRIYAAAGLDAADVAKIVGINMVTFWLGVAGAIGVALASDPTGIQLVEPFGAASQRMVGLAITAAVIALMVWLWRGEREVPLFGWRLPLPCGANALVLVLAGAIDITAAAATLYVLLPADVLPSFAAFLVLFVMAFALGTVSHVPAGLGVLEATILISLGAANRPDVIAGLLVFRVVYFGFPFALSSAAFALFEVWRARKGLFGISASAARIVRSIAPTVMAALVLVGGVVLLVSSNLPAENSRLTDLERLLPLPFLEGSHLLASIFGLLLIILARGLFLRFALARSVAIVVLLCGAAFALGKGLDWEEAVALVVIAGLLASFRGSFYRSADWRSFRVGPRWLALIAIALISLTFIGSLAYRDVDYSSELWWQFTWEGDAPRFLRATLAIAVATGLLAIDALINRPVGAHPMPTPVPDAVRRILSHCPTTQPMVALLGDKRFLIDNAGIAFLMYGIAGRSWITMGDPVGGDEAGRELVWRFSELVDRAGGQPVFFDLSSKFLSDYIDLGLTILKIGEVAKVDLQTFSLDGPGLGDLRRADRRAADDGLEFEVIPRTNVAARIDELATVSQAWLATKRAPERGFSLGRFEPAYLSEFDCAVMLKDGAIVAFADLWRGADKHEISPDLMRCRPGFSNALMQALFTRILIYGQSEGYRWFNLGAAPLSGLSGQPPASTWNRGGSFIYRHVDELYSFDGLRAFKQKFSPVWTPQYLACPAALTLPQVLLNVASLTSGGPPGNVRR